MSEERPNQGGIASEIDPIRTGDGLPADWDISPAEAGPRIGGSGQSEAMRDSFPANPVANIGSLGGGGAGKTQAETFVAPHSRLLTPAVVDVEVAARDAVPCFYGLTGSKDATVGDEDLAAVEVTRAVDEMRKFIQWHEKFEQAKTSNPLRVAELVDHNPGIPKLTDQVRENFNNHLILQKNLSDDYLMRFAGRVSQKCKGEGWIVLGRGGELVIDHFLEVKISMLPSRIFVEVNGERLDDPITIDRSVEMIRKSRAFIIRDTFDAKAFLKLLFDAYRHVMSVRRGGSVNSLVTLSECFRALSAVNTTDISGTKAARPRRRPTAGVSGAPPLGSQSTLVRPVKETAVSAQSRFRSDLSRLLASRIEMVVEGHNMRLYALRGVGGMMIVEPRSGNLAYFRSIEFERNHNDVE